MSDASYQAVGRVHRIGQTKETNVWHLVAADTAEEGLHGRLRARTAQHAAAAADGPVLIDDGPGLAVRSLLARPLDFYSARRLRASFTSKRDTQSVMNSSELKIKEASANFKQAFSSVFQLVKKIRMI